MVKRVDVEQVSFLRSLTGGLNKFFRSLYWKGAVVIVLGVLIYFQARIFYFLQGFSAYYNLSSSPVLKDLALEVESLFEFGLFSALLLTLIVIAGLIDLLYYLNLTRRFRRITRVINRIAGGDFSQRVAERGNDDVGVLASSFNRMADRISENIENLRRNDVLRRELVGNVAHDLGTPVTSIQGYTEMLINKDSELSSEDRLRFLNVVLNNAGILSRLVGELSSLSELELKLREPEFEDFSILSLSCDVCSRFYHKAELTGIGLEVQKEPSAPLVRGDINMIERLLSNLVDNAIKHSGGNCDIKIAFRMDNGGVEILVSDTGSGISEEDLPFIFERFYTGDKSRTRIGKQDRGSGLGLAVCQAVVKAHSAELKVRRIESGGVVFSFNLPVSKG